MFDTTVVTVSFLLNAYMLMLMHSSGSSGIDIIKEFAGENGLIILLSSFTTEF